MSKPVPLKLTYKNWRGEVSAREIIPISVRYGNNDYHKEDQWLLLCTDAKTGKPREFAMKDMAMWGTLTDNFGAT
jgi:hypothetical protein